MMAVSRRHGLLLIDLEGSGHSAAEIGAKGAGLDRLLSAGLPIPTTSVLTTEAYRLVVADEPLRLLIEDLRDSPLPGPDEIAAESAAIDLMFLASPLPEAVSAAVTGIGEEMLALGPVAVRSSATDDDIREASFSHQYLTVTNVSELRDLECAVRRCWASLWMPAARACRNLHHTSEDNLAMAVVIQTMVDPMWSGVVSTTDSEARPHLVRVEAVPESGEPQVPGNVTARAYTIRKDTLEIEPTDGIEPLDFLEDLGRLAIDLEQAERSPQDFEWAYTADGLTLLQMRPPVKPSALSTQSNPLDTSACPDATYTPHGVVEMLPGVISPLLWTINAPMLENAFRATLIDLGAQVPDRSRRIVNRFRGRAALDLSAIASVAAALPGGSAGEVERQYLGHPLGEDRAEHRRGVHLFAAVRARQVHNRIIDEVALVAAAASGLNATRLDLTELPVRRLVAYRQRIRDLAWRGYASEVGASSAASASYRALELLLGRWLPESDAVEWAQRVTRGALSRSAVGAARAKALVDVIDTHATSAIKDTIAHDREEQRRLIEDLDGGHAFLSALDDAVWAMGSKALYGDVTWAEDDWWIWRQLQLLITDGPVTPTSHTGNEDDMAELCTLLASDRRWRRIRVLTGQFIDMRQRWLRRQVSETIRFLELRERAKGALLVLGGEERRIIVEAARRLVDSRMMDRPDHVQSLTDSELDAMLFGRRGCSTTELTRRRQLTRAQVGSSPLPEHFTGHPELVEPASLADTDVLEGWAAGPGRAEGKVCIVPSLDEGTRLHNGDILVAHATDPSWTPLLLTAGAIVLETGGPLAHAAIVSREIGLPAVLNVASATKILEDGDEVCVDGNLGVVARD